MSQPPSASVPAAASAPAPTAGAVSDAAPAAAAPRAADVAAPGARAPGHISVFEFDLNQRPLGRGSFSEVVQCERYADRRKYALKMINKSKAQSKNVIKYVLNERRVMSLLNHPHIIKMLWTARDETNVYMFYEHAPRGELWELLQKFPARAVPVELARVWLAQLVSALRHVHSLGIVHRDVKPENILLAEDFSLKLCDFGTAKILADLPVEERRKALALAAATKKVDDAERQRTTEEIAKSAAMARENKYNNIMSDDEHRRRSIAYSVSRLNSFTGTPEYMAPEVVENKPTRFAPSADYWSVGVVAYQLLTGLLPFRGASAYLTFRATLEAPLALPASVPAAARELVMGLLESGRDRGDLGQEKKQDSESGSKDAGAAAAAAAAEGETGADAAKIGLAKRWGWDQVRDCEFFRGIDWAALETVNSHNSNNNSADSASNTDIRSDRSSVNEKSSSETAPYANAGATNGSVSVDNVLLSVINNNLSSHTENKPEDSSSSSSSGSQSSSSSNSSSRASGRFTSDGVRMSASATALLERLHALPLPGDSKRRGLTAEKEVTVTMEQLEREFGQMVVIEDGFIVPGNSENGGGVAPGAVGQGDGDSSRGSGSGKARSAASKTGRCEIVCEGEEEDEDEDSNISAATTEAAK